MGYIIKDLPFDTIDLETKKVFKAIANARTSLGELNGVCKSIPNPAILISTLSLQESKLSSKIENIIITTEDLYKSELFEDFNSIATKEVKNYSKALNFGFKQVKDKKILTNNIIIGINKIITSKDTGFRQLLGTKLKNNITGEIIYEPPQTQDEIIHLMNNLEQFINNNEINDLYPLVKLAIIHHRFESIHPFYDGNGRIGRIINILYLVLQGMLDLPILYLSRYINNNKKDYYKLLKDIQDNNYIQDSWIKWIVYILTGIDKTAQETIKLINQINGLIVIYKKIIKSKTNIYSHELLNNLFKHPYTKISFLQKDLDVQRRTASGYLNKLSQLEDEKGNTILAKRKYGREYYYFNRFLIALLTKHFDK